MSLKVLFLYSVSFSEVKMVRWYR